MKKAFSFIELLVVIVLILTLGVGGVPFLSNFISRNNLEVTADKLVGAVRKAQSYALDGKDQQTWGVCLQNGHIKLFRASCSSPNFSETYQVPVSVSISGLSETTFSKFRGEPSAALTVTLSTSSGGAKNINVNSAGAVEIINN